MSDLERIFPETIRSIDTSTFTGSYQAVGTAIAQLIRIIKFTNNSTVTVTISWNGTDDHEILPSGSFLLMDVMSDKQNLNGLVIPIGTQFYAKGSAGSGSLYISTYYAR